jgi:hypothetical protein
MYRRYMVFEWTTYDNAEPFDCVSGSFDSLERARALSESLKDYDDPDCGKSCVFDRVKGELV